jgi:hypothetical protein
MYNFNDLGLHIFNLENKIEINFTFYEALLEYTQNFAHKDFPSIYI